jgi:hypothetical protein
VDLGLRSGLACYGPDGRLQWYRSTNFGTRARLKRGAYTLLSDAHAAGQPVTRLIVEGGGDLAPPWLHEATRRGIFTHQIHALAWREAFLLDREQRSGKDAKRHADRLARQVIAWSDLPKPTSLRHDAAEAIMIGLFGVVEAGLVDRTELPFRAPA